jgi:cellulose 1,4-beta-cellobiosidase
MFGSIAAITALSLLGTVAAQQAGTRTPERHPSLSIKRCTRSGSSKTCTNVGAQIVLDSNWRWAHSTTGTDNCYWGDTWNSNVCPNGKTCAANCAVDGIDNYASNYGVSTAGDALSLRYLTKDNTGSRVYLLANDDKYFMFKLKNQEFAFDVDLSTVGCGLNAALYLAGMEEDGGKAKHPGNKAGAKYGTGYCDAQCPHERFINGEVRLVTRRQFSENTL